MARSGFVVDAGPLYASLDSSDRHHAAALETLATHPGPMVVPQLVVAQVAHFLETRVGSDVEARFLGLLAEGFFLSAPIEPGDWLRIAELVWRYRDLPLGTVDASIVAVAERLDIRTIATFDRRDFAAVKPAHVEAFELLP